MGSAARGAHRTRRGTGHIVAAARLQLVYLTFTANRAHKPRFTTKIIETWAIIQRLQRFNCAGPITAHGFNESGFL